MHAALRLRTRFGMVRLLADLAEHPRTIAAARMRRTKKSSRSERNSLSWPGRAARVSCTWRKEPMFHAWRKNLAWPACASRKSRRLWLPVFRERLRAAMRIPAIEALFPAPWTALRGACFPVPARSSPRPPCGARCSAGACWSCWLNRSTRRTRRQVALDLFDRLRLREPFAQAFGALGFEGEESWRVAARIKVLLLTGAGVGQQNETRAVSCGCRCS